MKDTNAIRHWLVQRIANECRLSVDKIDITAQFHGYGLSSLVISRLSLELATELGISLSPTAFWEYPSIDQLARHLSGNEQPRAAIRTINTESRSNNEFEPIAIIGMACRFPGASDPDAFWQMLAAGTESVGDVPRDEWVTRMNALDIGPTERRKIQRAGWLENVSGFDTFFFGISPREASAMDPQQRLALELTWEALEDGGIVPDEIIGSRTGVFASAIWSDYAIMLDRAGTRAMGQHSVTGWHRSIIANRISYFFGLQGPSFALDAACSSCLVAVHLACESLRRNESTLAIVPAVNLNLLPESGIGVARFGALSDAGHCHTFDSRADGYVRGEGGAVVLLKRLSAAIGDGNRVHAVIRASAVNNDGASNGLTAPNPKAQEALLREVYERASVSPHDVQYVEAHGTATPLGDPIEAKALGAVLGVGRKPDQRLLVGSAKTNVGHLEGAAGAVGLLKVVMSLMHRQIPASLHFDRPNPHIPLEDLGLEVPTSLRQYPFPDRRIIAGVSSFGLGGTNAHVVMEEWPRPRQDAHFLPSAVSIDKVGCDGVVFVFPGQGAQWQGMARFLLQSSPVFRAAFQECDDHVQRLVGFSVLEELVANPVRSRLDRIEVSLPAIISIDIAMSRLWQSLGVEPAAVVGHSTGEIAAAHIAGALDLGDTMRVICAYGQLVSRFSGKAYMAQIELPWDQVSGILSSLGVNVHRAIWDSTETTILAGENDELDRALLWLQRQGISTRKVNINVAPHCPLVDSVRDELADELRDIQPRHSRIPFISEVTGTAVAGTALDSMHWVKNFADPALFSAAIDGLIASGHRVFLDVGPHPITKHAIETNLRTAKVRGHVLASMIRNEQRPSAFEDSLAKLRELGQMRPSSASQRVFVPISARTPDALRALAQSYAHHLRATKETLESIAFTTGVCRSHHPIRLAWTGSSKAELETALRAISEGESAMGAVTGQAPNVPAKTVFVFPGQGSQWVGMGRSLFNDEPIFARAIHGCDAAIQKQSGFSVVAELHANEDISRLNDIAVVQPVLFAMSVALAALWHHWGVAPAAVVGHSMGEVAAAHVAGALSLDDAAAIICRRSQLLRKLSGRGAMALVELTMTEAERAVAERRDRLSVAVSNGPRSTVIAGDPEALDEVIATLQERGVFCRRINVDVASHSPQMDSLRDDLVASLQNILPRHADVPIYSTVTGECIRGTELLAPYWSDNLRRPVHFSQAVQNLLASGHTVFIEMSPHPILIPAIEENIRELSVDAVALASLRRGHNERTVLLDSLTRLYVSGHALNFRRLNANGGRAVTLPGYPWQRQHFWIENDSSHTTRNASSVSPQKREPLTLAAHPQEKVWEQELQLNALPYLADHRVDGAIVFPGAAYISAMIALTLLQFDHEKLVLEKVEFTQMLALKDDATRRLQFVLTEQDARCGAFLAASQPVGERNWTRHAAANVRVLSAKNCPDVALESPNRLQKRLVRFVSREDHYRRMHHMKLQYGPRFQGVAGIWLGQEGALAQITPDRNVEEGDRLAFSAWLDSCLQVSAALTFDDNDVQQTFVPVSIGRLTLHRRPGGDAWVWARPSEKLPGNALERIVDLCVLNAEGIAIVVIEALHLRCLREVPSEKKHSLAECVHEVVFRKMADLPAPTLCRGDLWILFCDRKRLGLRLAHALAQHGLRCVVVFPGTHFARVENHVYTIDIGSASEYMALLREVCDAGAICRGVVHLLSLDSVSAEHADAQSIAASLAHGSVSATYLAQALVRHGFRDPPRLILATRGAQAVFPSEPVAFSQSPILGLGKTIALEHPELGCKRIDLDSAEQEGEVDSLLREMTSTDAEDQVALRTSGRYAARLVGATFSEHAGVDKIEPAKGRPFAVRILDPGQLDRLSLYAATMPSPGPDEVVIEVEAAGLNFQDVLLALGALNAAANDATKSGLALGEECAGRIVAVGQSVADVPLGEHVIGIAEQSFSSFVVAKRDLIVAKPARLDWTQAATLPIAFLTAIHALRDIARLRRNETVLIHAGAGGVGLAAIQWAKHVGAEVFATAGNEQKRAFLRSLGVNHVFDSRSLSFVEEIKRLTHGQGIDVVLNSLAGDFIEASLALLKDYGRFVEIGKRDVFENRAIGLRPFLRNLSYSLLDLKRTIASRTAIVRELLADVVSMIDRGLLSPLPTTTFPISRVAEAFQYMAQAKHTGKIALEMKDPNAAIILNRQDRSVLIRNDRTYLITGGLGGIGLTIARGLVEQGAGCVVLLGRNAPTKSAEKAIQEMRARRTKVLSIRVDVSRAKEVAQALAMIRDELPPVAGVVHAAAVLDDRTIMQHSATSFETVFAAKALGAWNLHQLTQEFDLDFFVMYSSVAALMGSPGQGNYCAANAFLDALSQHRLRMGLPAMSIQWGAFAEVGLAAAQKNRGERLASRGTGSLTPTEGFVAFLQLLNDARANVGMVRFDPRQWIEYYPAAAKLPFFSEIVTEGASIHGARQRVSKVLEHVKGASVEQGRLLLEQHLVEHIAAVVRCNPSEVNRSTPFQSLGIDSLMSLELRNRLEASLGIRLSATILFTHSTVVALGSHLAGQLGVATKATHTIIRSEADQGANRAQSLPEGDKANSIAVVGMACRFPGGGDSPETFWQALEAGKDGIRRIPPERWPSEMLPEDRPETRWAGLLDCVDAFDAAFFRISPREAANLDPQQRLLLEVAWEALERAGQAPDQLVGTLTGVFVGMCNADYSHILRRAGSFDAYTATGSMFSTAAGRISYTFGFQGPCMTIDTACSSSLAAAHLAVQSLRSGECSLALACGVNLLLDPVSMRIAAETQALSPDGRCKAFDATANGFVRGEGCAVLVLKRVADAERDGDRIWAIIRSSAMNQDGQSAGLTAPNVLSQQMMLRRAIENAGLAPEDIGYIETHGTGTSLGDPIEFEALKEVFGKNRASGSPCVLGAVKTNIGHLEGAAGAAGLIKATLCLVHESIPRNLHFKTLNPRISLEQTPFRFPGETIPWKRDGKPRRAGVNSFGISGTNVHIILEEAPPKRTIKPMSTATSKYLLPLSAKTAAALHTLSSAYAKYIANSNASLPNIVYTASVRRAHLDCRVAFFAETKEEFVVLLEAFATDPNTVNVVIGHGDEEAANIALEYVSGGHVDWKRDYSQPGEIIELPTYPWQRERYWMTNNATETLLEHAPDSGDPQALESLVRNVVASVLRKDPAQIGPDTPFFQLGMDSLMSLEIRNRLEARLEQRLSANTILANPTVFQLAGYLGKTLPPFKHRETRKSEARHQAPSTNSKVFRRVLLTGATGFLGIHLLGELLQSKDDLIHCLVRAENEEAAMRRLRSAMRHYCGSTEADWSRVVPLLGDMSQPRLSMDDKRFQRLAHEIDVIYHNGAMLDFALPYERLAPTNVEATAEIIGLARISGRVRLHHVSTVGVLPTGHPRRDDKLLETEVADHGPELIPCGYTQTKRAAERLVLDAQKQGLPAIVYRPSIIAGSVMTGAWNLDDAICRILRGCIQAAAVPDIDWRLNLAPVDFVARAVCFLSDHAASKETIFHLANAESMHFKEIADFMRERGYALRMVSYDDWLKKIESQGKENAIYPLLPWIYSANPFLNVEYDCSNLLRALQDTTIQCPTINAKLLGIYFDSFIKANFLPDIP